MLFRSAHPEAHDTNFAGFLPLWDLVFGTYRMPKGERPVRYGIGESLPDSWWAHLCSPFRRVVRPF